MMRPMKLVKKTSSIQMTALSMPRAFASRATQTSNAMLRTKIAIKIKKNEPQQANPAAGLGSLDCCANTALVAFESKRQRNTD